MTEVSRPGRARVIVFAVVAVLVVGCTVGYVWRQRSDDTDPATRAKTTDLASLRSEPRIVFRNEDRDQYGKVAMVALSDPSGPRAVTSTACDRVYTRGGRTLCLALDRVAVTYRSRVLDADGERLRTLPLSGIPSRARLSPDGRLAASTAFTAVGDSYASRSFSTRTYVSRTTGPRQAFSLEDFTLVHHGHEISPVDRNYWGVTFADDDNRFYATVAFGGHTWLVRGDLGSRSVRTLRSDAECPSLSPDGTRLVYKKRLGRAAGRWRLAALDIRTGRETLLAEKRSVDDQVEWLDDGHVLYALQGKGKDKDPYLNDVFTVPADGSGQPDLLIRHASSPSVVR